ncbi:MAG: BCD family MFS transporter [Anaerolineae bacterium]|nr:BCD family MFS transporter [Anaerolineae bacterium]
MENNLTVARNLKIALFHLGSGMADVLATGVWNRIMISDLGFSATPISLLVSLRYFLAPLGIWAGRMSDRHAVGGYRRLFWIWLGRAMMVLSVFAVGLTTTALARGAEATLGVWAALSLGLLLFSLGNALSGSTFLALIYDRAPEHQRGRAVGLVWTFLLLGFTIGGILFGVMLPSSEESSSGLSFTPETLQNLFVMTALILGSLWFFSLLGEERRSPAGAITQAGAEAQTSLRADLRRVWDNPHTRFFLVYLSCSMIFAFAQDAILEPFAGDVFNMDARHTTRFAAYWGSMSILGSLLFLGLSRRVKRLDNTMMSYIGVGTLVLTFALFSISSLGAVRELVTPGLILLGLGLGLWNIGTLGLMMDMSPAARAGTFLGFWTMAVTFARGFGVSGGGILRDLLLSLTGSHQFAYGAVFVLEFAGLLVAIWALRRVNVHAYKAGQETPADMAQVLAGALE